MDTRERAERLVGAAKVAVEGQRGSDTTFALAVTLIHGLGLDEDTALDVMLGHWNPRCLPPWSQKELAKKVRDAATRGTPPGGKPRLWLLDGPEERTRAPRRSSGGPRPPAVIPDAEPDRARFDVQALRRFRRPECERADWWRGRSPVRRPGDLSAGSYLEAVFRPGERVLVFAMPESQGQWIYWVGKGWFELGRRPGMPAVACREPGGGERGLWFLSNPVSGKWMCRSCGHVHGTAVLAHRACPECGPGTLKEALEMDRVLSRRSAANVTAFRYLVLEHDPPEGADVAEHAGLWSAFVAQLPLPLVSFCSSGGKSHHALIRLPARTKAEWDTLRGVCIRYLERYGADPAAIRAVQLTRLPNVRREDKGAVQELLYLDPGADDQTPLVARGQ